MPAGDIVSNIANIAGGEYLDMRPAAGVTWCIHNISYMGAMELYFCDGTSNLKLDADSTPGARLNLALHCNNIRYYRLKNVSGTSALMSYDGVQTNGSMASSDNAEVYCGETAADSVGVDGDLYINKATGDVYNKSGAAWGSPIGSISGALVARYVHSGNKEVYVSAVDINTSTFTAVSHGFVNGDRVTPFFNNDNAVINYNLKYFPGALTQGQFYIIDAAVDTFRISTTLGGGVLALSSNTDMDLTKWHFEKSVDTVYINNLPNVKKLKVIVYGQAPSGSYILPNNASNYASATFMQTGNNIITRYPSISYGGMLSRIEAIIDSTDWLTISANGYKIIATSATANTVSLVNVSYIHTLDRNFTFNSIKMPTFYPANGLIIEVYKL